MKSIKQWMSERGMLAEDVDKNAMTRYFGSSQVEVDQDLRRELRPKIERVMDMDEYKTMPKEELLQRMKVVISQIVAEVGGSTATSRGLAGKLSDSDSVVDRSKFARMMGSERLEVDQILRREMKPKIERIMDMEEYRSIPKSDLENKLIAVVSQLIAGMSGASMSLGNFARKIGSFEEDPIAQESQKLPSFLRWAENSEGEGLGDSTSEPQHKEGEGNMDLKSIVEKRMMQIAMELESDGKGSRKDVLAAMKAVVDSASKEVEQAGSKEQPQQPAESPPSGAVAQPTEPQNQQI